MPGVRPGSSLRHHDPGQVHSRHQGGDPGHPVAGLGDQGVLVVDGRPPDGDQDLAGGQVGRPQPSRPPGGAAAVAGHQVGGEVIGRLPGGAPVSGVGAMAKYRTGSVTTAPFGTWPSPLSPAAMGGARISLAGLQVGADGCWWSESRPHEGGRMVVMRLPAGGRPAGGLAPRRERPLPYPNSQPLPGLSCR